MAYDLKTIAKMTGYSVSTVSRVVNGKGRVSQKTRDKILEIVDEYNYVPNQIARSLKSNATNTVGIIVPDIREYFYKVIRSADAIFSKHGYSILLADSNEDPEKEEMYIKLMYEKRVDGLILATVSNEFKALDIFFNNSVPVVFIDNLPEVDGAYEDCVLLDNAKASSMAIDQFVKEGHRRIAIISGTETEMTGHERMDGYLRSMRLHGFEPDERLVKIGRYEEEEGYRCMAELLENRQEAGFTAVYVSSYKMSCGAFKAIKEKELRIPDDVAVIAFDFTDDTGLITPTITSVVQPIERIGRIVAERLIDRMKMAKQAEDEREEDFPQKIILAPGMLLGESSRYVK
ncbi:MAG: LacI family transcriptional regulator [Clostridium sp.]|nr:LacI family transcriptional regulator [Clostridium sp.]